MLNFGEVILPYIVQNLYIPSVSSISCWAKGSTATSIKTASTWRCLDHAGSEDTSEG